MTRPIYRTCTVGYRVNESLSTWPGYRNHRKYASNYEFYNNRQFDSYSEWVSDCCLTPTQKFFSYIMARTINFQWNDDEVRFVLEEHIRSK